MSDMPRLESHDGNGSHEIILPTRRSAVPASYAPARVVNATVSEADDVTVFMQYLRVLWKHKFVLLGGALAGILLGLGISLWLTPMYQAMTTLEIQNIQEPFAASMLAKDPSLATQVQLLSSATMRGRVIKKLENRTPAESPNVKDPLASLRRMLGMSDPAQTVKWDEAIYTAAGRTQVSSNRDSRILQIVSRSPHPQAAADFSLTLAQEYIARNQEERWESYQTTGEWLTRAQEDLKKKVEESERQAYEYARANGLIFTGAQNISEEKLRQLQVELARAQVDRIEKESIYQSSLSSPEEALPEVLDSGPMASYQVRLSELKQRLAELSTTLTPNHYRTQQVQAQINELEANRERERKNILSRIRIEFEASKKREDQLQRDFNRQTSFMSGQANELIQYNMLLREVETNKKLYESTLTQGKEASLASAMRASNARVVDPANVPVVPNSPNLSLNMGLGLMGGLILSVVFVIVRSTVDPRIQLPGTLGVQLNLRELGVIPAASTDPQLKGMTRLLPKAMGGKKAKAGSSTNILIPVEEKKQSWQGLELVTWVQKDSVVSEAFRSAMTSILFSGQNGDRPQVLVITSPAPQEGKTTVVSNLAIALAEINQRVLLIDADMRLPRMHSIFDVPNTFGLSDFLHERRPIEEYIDEELVRQTQIPNLHVMPAGPARSNLSRLLYSSRMKDLLWRFRGMFDTILIDSAPVLHVPDARILARASDAVVLVVRAHRTDQESAFAAVRCFEEDGRRVLGTILNDWNPKLSDFGPYGSYGMYKGYGAYGTHYGPSAGYSQAVNDERL